MEVRHVKQNRKTEPEGTQGTQWPLDIRESRDCVAQEFNCLFQSIGIHKGP